MIRQVIRGATFRRDAYLRAVIGSNGTGDAVVIVAGVYVILALTISIRATTDVVGHARFVLNGGFAWLILSGIVYLIARHGFHGEGSFQGVVAIVCWMCRAKSSLSRVSVIVVASNCPRTTCQFAVTHTVP